MMKKRRSDEDTSHYEGALLEEINHRIILVAEAVGALSDVPADVSQLKEDMVDVKQELVVIRSVVKGQSSELKDHDRRLKTLERT